MFFFFFNVLVDAHPTTGQMPPWLGIAAWPAYNSFS
jgi:hypothetical protein